MASKHFFLPALLFICVSSLAYSQEDGGVTSSPVSTGSREDPSSGSGSGSGDEGSTNLPLTGNVTASLPPFPISNVAEYIVDVFRFNPATRQWTSVHTRGRLDVGAFPYTVRNLPAALYTVRVDYTSSLSGLRRTLTHELNYLNIAESTFGVFVPSFQRGQVVIDTPASSPSEPSSAILINLPFGLVSTSTYMVWMVEWRQLGMSQWSGVNASINDRSVSLPQLLANGASYELRLRALGMNAVSAYTIPLRFPLELQGQTTTAGLTTTNLPTTPPRTGSLAATLPPFTIPNVAEYIVDVHSFDPSTGIWSEERSVRLSTSASFPYTIPGLPVGLYTVRVDFTSSVSSLQRTLSHELGTVLNGNPGRFVPSFQRGQVVVDTPTQGMTSSVLINLPIDLVNSTIYQTWNVEWRMLGARDWSSVSASTTARSVSLPQLLPQRMSYELRLRAVGRTLTSPYTVPLRFPLEMPTATCAEPDNNANIANLERRTPNVGSSTSYPYNTRLRYSCLEGFTLNGTAARRCQANGQWSGQTPVCQGTARVYVDWFAKHNDFVRALEEFDSITPGPTAEVIQPVDETRILQPSFWHTALDSWLSTTQQWRQQMTLNGFTAPSIPAMLSNSQMDVRTRWAAAVNYTSQAQSVWYQAAQSDTLSVSPTEQAATEGSNNIYSEDLWLATSRNGDSLLSNWRQRRQ